MIKTGKLSRVLALLMALVLIIGVMPVMADDAVFADGNYYVDVELWKQGLDEESMGSIAFKNNPKALVTVDGGKVTKVQFATNPVRIGTVQSALIAFTSDDAKDVTPVEKQEFTTSAGNTYKYVKLAQFTMPDKGQPKSAAAVTYVQMLFCVPDTPMDSAPSRVVDGVNYMEARMRFKWSTMIKTEDTKLVPNTEMAMSNLTVTRTDAATAVKLDTDTDRVYSTDIKFVVERITSGADYNKAAGALAGTAAPWKLYKISILDINGKPITTNGQVKISLPCAQTPTVYRINDSGRKVGIQGQLNGSYYSFNTTTLGLFAMVGGFFTDVNDSDYFGPAVNWALTHEPQITNGMAPTLFMPAETCTRAQIVTFLWRANGKPSATAASNFVDVARDAWFYDAVCWAVEKGITNGMDKTHFMPDEACTRAQMVTFLWRSEGKPATDANASFADVPSGSFYHDAVCWAVSKNITKGMDATHFMPDFPCQRAHAVTFLQRTFG